MKVSFWKFLRLGANQWRGYSDIFRKTIWLLFGVPDIHSRIRNAHVINAIENLDIPSDAKILDLGCGRAISLFHLADDHSDWKIFGIEFDEEKYKSCNNAAINGNYQNLKFIYGSITEIKSSNQYNVIIMIDVLEHIEDDFDILSKIYSSIIPGGYLIVHVPKTRTKQWRLLPGFKNFEVETHVRDEYQEIQIKEIIIETGMDIIQFHQTFGKLAELSFEINNLFFNIPILRKIIAIITLPFTIPLAYLDTLNYQDHGNSYLIVARKLEF